MPRKPHIKPVNLHAECAAVADAAFSLVVRGYDTAIEALGDPSMKAYDETRYRCGMKMMAAGNDVMAIVNSLCSHSTSQQKGLMKK